MDRKLSQSSDEKKAINASDENNKVPFRLRTPSTTIIEDGNIGEYSGSTEGLLSTISSENMRMGTSIGGTKSAVLSDASVKSKLTIDSTSRFTVLEETPSAVSIDLSKTTDEGELARKGVLLRSPSEELHAQQIYQMIARIKKLTMLVGLKQEMWTVDHELTMETFLTNSVHNHLIIYLGQSGSLIVSLQPPMVQVKEIYFFLKNTGVDTVTPENFMKVIHCGNMKANLLVSLLNRMKTIFAPVILQNKTWPETVKNVFAGQLYSFMASLTDTRYKLKGQTRLYIPSEGLDIPVPVAARDKEFIQRLEGVLLHWVRQLKELAATEGVIEVGDRNGPIEEIEYWFCRCEDLSGVVEQLHSSKHQHFLQIMQQAKSTHITTFEKFANQIIESSNEAQSNYKFLLLLKESCIQLRKSLPHEIPVQLPKLINLIRVIWANSPYYNTRERITGMFQKVSNEIIKQCCKSISLEKIIGGYSVESSKNFKDCIKACTEWKKIYEELARVHHKNSHIGWFLEITSIFAQVDAFIQRCNDLLQICDCQIHFARKLHGPAEPLPPIFSGRTAPQLKQNVLEVEQSFEKAMNLIVNVKDSALDVRASVWHDAYSKFHLAMKDLDIMVQNIINTAFETVLSVSEAISLLDAFFHFNHRETIKRVIDKKIVFIYNMINEKINYIRKDFAQKAWNFHPVIPIYAGNAFYAIALKHHIEDPMKDLLDSWWFPRYGMGQETISQYNLLVAGLNEYVQKMYQEWLATLEGSPSKLLEIPLMCHSFDKPHMLESNFDRTIWKTCQEIVFWKRLRFQIPHKMNDLFEMKETLRNTHENILRIVRDYNKMVSLLTDDEQLLFKERITYLDRKIHQGLTRLTWSNPIAVDIFIVECRPVTTKTQNLIDIYKQASADIGQCCQNISNLLLIRINMRNIYENEEYEIEQGAHRIQTKSKIMELHKKICMLVEKVYDIFKQDGSEVRKQWWKFCDKIDWLVDEALNLVVRKSLKELLRAVAGEGKTPPMRLFRMKVTLTNNELDYIPTIRKLAFIVSSTHEEFCNILKGISRIATLLSTGSKREHVEKVLRSDQESIYLQNQINSTMSNLAIKLHNYLDIWNPYKDIWEVNKDLFIERYQKMSPTVATFDADIARYTELANNIQTQETLTYMQFVVIDSSLLKHAILEHCLEWQNKFTTLLKDISITKLSSIYNYIETNTRKLKHLPETLDELKESVLLYQTLTKEKTDKYEEFEPLREQFIILAKYEVPVPDMTAEMLTNLEEEWRIFMDCLVEADEMLKKYKDKFKSSLLSSADDMKKVVSVLLDDFKRTGPFSSSISSPLALAQIQEMLSQLNEMKKKEENIRKGLAYFKIDQPPSRELQNLEKDLVDLKTVWELTIEWEEMWEKNKIVPFTALNVLPLEDSAVNLLKRVKRIVWEVQDKNWEIAEFTQNNVDLFRRTLPIVVDLKNTSMRERHWEQVKNIVGQMFDETSEEFNLEQMMQFSFDAYADPIYDISVAASKELAIEEQLNVIKKTWETVSLDMAPYKEKVGQYFLRSSEEVFQTLEDNQMSLTTMKASRYVKPFEAEVDQWEWTLSSVLETVESIMHVQRLWMYLENIFVGEDIRKQLPGETRRFDLINEKWLNLTTKFYHDKNALRITRIPGLVETLTTMANDMEEIQKSLDMYLETKRRVFPRFYFISNDDLLEILGQSKNPVAVQPHLKKCFDNIVKLKLFKALYRMEAHGMYSAEGEYVEFHHPLPLDGPVETWLSDLEEMMQHTLRELLNQCRLSLKKNLSKRDKWIKDWPGQLCITSNQIQWTGDCTRALGQAAEIEDKRPLKIMKKKQVIMLNKFTEAIRSDLPKLQRLKIVALVTIEVHARDVIERLIKTNTMDTNGFEWLSQLRFYWENNDCMTRQTNTQFLYKYEYLGNSGRLVITPLTDRCYITLTTALHLHRGGSPKGPAGTGKTETVKDLGKALATYVIVINCSEGLDYISMGKMFSGLAQSGAWICYDEFNRINVEVLSVVAQQVISILSALANGLTRFIFIGHEINLEWSCGMFITMNPGYAGRTELPDNLKSMFRPISMVVPDSTMIAEIILFGEGFENTRILAKKVTTLYALCTQQLSKQDHYDFGLRGLVSVLRHAGRKRRENPHLPNEEVLLLAMKDMNVPKLTASDLPLFNGIINDLFPGIEVSQIDYSRMIRAIKMELDAQNYQSTLNTILKVIQLFETKNSRHSTMVVGNTECGKSVMWKILQNTLSRLCNEKEPGFNLVRVCMEFPLNPKAISLAELYGEFNLSTGEWMDGILSSIARQTCSDEKPDEKWIVFDGPVDTLWIESMNSLMDDNKVLTLINGERISMPEQVSLLFETQDLSVASPATVSRCGMVYQDYKNLGWRPYVDSWLQKQSKPNADELRKLFDLYMQKLLDYKHIHCDELIPLNELAGVRSLCELLESLVSVKNEVIPEQESFQLLVRLLFIFCSVWSVCAAVDKDSRFRIDSYIREAENTIPNKDTVYEYFVDTKLKIWVPWEDRLPRDWKYNSSLPFFKIVVPTVDTVRYNFLVSLFLKRKCPVLLVGQVGTGKTSIAQNVINEADPNRYKSLIINMSAQTTSNDVQEIIESKTEKRTKGIYFPIGGKTMITLLDDLNMPAKDTFGSQPPLELIRMWLDYGFWFDRSKQVPKYVKGMILMSAMGPPGGGRTEISQRLQSKFSLLNMPFPHDSQIKRIYGTMIIQKLFDFDEEVKSLSDNISQGTIDMYNLVSQRMLPTPTKIHYLFNLRDISKVFQGLLRAHKDFHDSVPAMLRLWIHECFRVFADRLVDDKDKDLFIQMISETLASVFNHTFHNLCPNKQPPLFVDYMHVQNVYQDIKDTVSLKNFVEGKLNEYNNIPGRVNMPLVPFHDAIEHLSRIIRVIRQPRGNMLLIGIGGSGRQSLSKLAAFICKFTTFQIEVKRNYRKFEFREDLKNLYSLTGVDNKATAFLFVDTQAIDESFMEDINNILSSGEVPNLFRPDELEQLKSELVRPAKFAGINPDDSEAMTTFFIDRVRANLHVILCMSPIGEPFRNRIRMYPAFVNCTTIDWFSEWPQDALLEVADRFLEGVNLEGGSGKRLSIARIFSTMHKSVSIYSQRLLLEMKRHNYVTPTNYLELVASYKKLLADKRKELGDAINKLRMGLFKLEDTRTKVEIMSVELEDAKVKVAEFQKQCDEYLIIIVQQKRDADEQARLVAARSEKIGEEEIKCKKMAELALADLNVVMPALEEAVSALDSLNKKDLTEIKSYGRPPPLVERVMEAVMILRGADPTWAESKRQLGDPNFIKQLKEFDKDNIPDKVLKKIGTYCSDPEFFPEIIGKVSGAARSLCMWVRAMEVYGRVFRIVFPKKVRLMAAEAELKDKQRILAEAKANLEELQEKIEDLRRQYDEKLVIKEELRQKAEDLVLKLERAEKLVEGLSGEKDRWELTVKMLEEKLQYVIGDCLMAAGCVSYLGPFLSNYRESMINEVWNKEIRNNNIMCDPEFKLAAFLVKPTTVREWNYQGLPNDEFSTENGIIVTTGNRWPLMVDPQCQAQKWIKNMEGKRNLKVIDQQQADFLNVIEWAVREGWPVLLQNIKEELDPALAPILNRSVVMKDGKHIIKLGEKEVEYNMNFRFYITTKLSNPHYSPEIASATFIVNFAVKEQGLESQLLGIVVRKERPELENMKDNLVLNIASGKEKLKALEDEILRLLNETQGSLLDDEVLVNTLQSSKKISSDVIQQVEIAVETEVSIDHAREEYRPCAQRASILFFVLNDMNRIDPMYEFSLDSYIEVFINSIDKSQKSTNLEDRIRNINDYHTYAMYRFTCRGLFERHKLLFSFHMCSKILEAAGKLNMDEFNFFLRGGVVLDRAGQVDNPCTQWLSDTAWDNITELDKLANFHGVIQSFEQYPRDWHQWYTSPEPENTPMPGDWQTTCNELQKMVFVRCLRPDRVSVCASSFIVNNLGARFVEPPMLDINAVLEDSSSKTPLVFVLSPGVDPTSALIQLAETRQMMSRFQFLSLGQGQAPAATRMIENGSREGLWVFLANCHLSMSWMPDLEKMVENIQVEDPHPDFRLWLSSSPHPDFPISILQVGIKMTTEPPKGIKTNMARLYNLITEQQFEACRKPEKYKNLLYALCFFHSILLERRKFQQLGWNVNYSFNDSDFEVSESLLSIYIDEYDETPWDALKYLIAGVMYGGHVTDDWDRRLLLTYIGQFFCDEAIETMFFKLSSLPTYYIPRNGPLYSYKDLIKTLPNVDSPEAFGQHNNADISSQIIETENLFNTMLSLQVQVSVSTGESREEKVLNLSADVLSKIPDNIDYETTAKILAPDPSPFNVVLLQEILRYNFLLTMIRRSLIDLDKGIQGLVVMSADLEEVFLCIYDGKVPSSWLRAYPSMKPLGSWTRDLLLRVDQFAVWAATARPPVLFWLAGFTFPTGFLTAVLQSVARRNNFPIDTLTWEFAVSPMEESHLLEGPTEGVYVRGTFLEGAGWDKKNMCLIDASPMQLICPMPVIHFRPVENKKKSLKGLYICPCYYFPNRSGTTDRASFVVAVDLKSGAMPADHWIKRGTALLLSLAY